MAQNESGFVLNVQIAAELKGGDALNRVYENADRGQVITDRELRGRQKLIALVVWQKSGVRLDHSAKPDC